MGEGDDAGEADAPREGHVEAPGLAPLDTYTRADALRDGALLDATDMAATLGFTVPVALTHAAWRRAVALTLAAHAAGQDEAGRLWDLLSRFRDAVRQRPAASLRRFSLPVVTDSPTPALVTLHGITGRGDHGEPVITIALPNED